MMSDQAEHTLVVAFPDESQSFANGFEAGMIWERMRSGSYSEINATTRAENRPVISRMAIADGWDVKVAETGVEGWDNTILTKIKTPPARSNPYGLKVVTGSLGGDP